MGSDIYFNKEHNLVRKAVKDFVNKEINPYVDQWEEEGMTPLHDIFGKMGELGFLGIRFDEKYGGEGLDYWYELVFLEEIAHIRQPVTVVVATAGEINRFGDIQVGFQDGAILVSANVAALNPRLASLVGFQQSSKVIHTTIRIAGFYSGTTD